jgi:alkylation response protein AidB-like acyl-CoA dehydrogenase
VSTVRGLNLMFTFMNTARIGTAIQGLAHAELSYQGALEYAKERLAMRSLTGAEESRRAGGSRSSCTPTCAACC